MPALPPTTTSRTFGRAINSAAMLSALVTTVRSRRSASALATSVVVVPPVMPTTSPSATSLAAASPIARFSRAVEKPCTGWASRGRRVWATHRRGSAAPGPARAATAGPVGRGRRNFELLGQAAHVDTSVLDRPIENLGHSALLSRLQVYVLEYVEMNTYAQLLRTGAVPA